MILETFNLSKRFGSIVACNNLSISIEKGTAYGLLGPNGSGKTTTLGIVMSVLNPDSGSFRWFDKEAVASAYNDIGCLLEVPNFLPYLSLYKNLELIARIREVDLNSIDRALDETRLLNRRKSRFDTLSLGMKQRLSIASTLLGNPGVLVLDEPANGLDPEGIAEVRSLILQQRENGKTIIMASHILDEVEKVCTHIGVLKQGSVITSGKVEDLLKLDDLIIVGTDSPAELKKELMATGKVVSVTLSGNMLEIVPEKGFNTASINKLAYEKGIEIKELRVRKSTLEEQFLELVK
jgi:ABC-type multidrug transport system ATPase subunit